MVSLFAVSLLALCARPLVCSAFGGKSPLSVHPLRPKLMSTATPIVSRQGVFPRRTRAPAAVRAGNLDSALGLSGGGIDAAPSSLVASISESVSPIVSSLFAYEGSVPLYQAFGLNAVLFGLLSSKLKKMLTPEGFAHSVALGTLLWTTLGWRGWSLCVLYLFLGQAVTKVKFEEKQKAGIAEGRGGRRGPENVWGSALTGLVCAAASVQGDSFLGISSDLFVLGYVASLATKLADTFASEIGKAYGKTAFLITTFERVEPGTEGAVSAEGTAAAAVGGLALALYGLAVDLIDVPGVAVATVAAFLATNAESLIGATLQEKEGFRWMTNEVVNFINTLIGAALAIGAGKFLLGM
mmetsp:Transcript_10988/g.32539  ORF Transcript_10988/g.32539 Transcript_10988/m.32539 type:complete len:354 (-) Transcript_10988:246-1307(-)